MPNDSTDSAAEVWWVDLGSWVRMDEQTQVGRHDDLESVWTCAISHCYVEIVLYFRVRNVNRLASLVGISF